MTEVFLSFLWKHKMFQQTNLIWENERVEIVHPGHLNTNAGADFVDARVKIGNTLWAGNVEIHINSSDWEEHNHDQNQAFDNVILHVVSNYNKDIYTSKGRKVPTIPLKYNDSLWSNYQSLLDRENWIPCAISINNIDPFTVNTWLHSLSIERLEGKTAVIGETLRNNRSNWEETFYYILCNAFGFHINAAPFGLLAKNTPFKIIKKHSNSLHEIEALLFGQAGFLIDDYSDDSYYKELKKTYEFLKAKYDLKCIESHLWKFLRLRPGNFPTIRIAQLANLLFNNQELLQNILDVNNLDQLQKNLNSEASEYWAHHYTFNNISDQIPKHLGIDSTNNIIINTIVPFFYAYGEINAKPNLKDLAFEFLDKIKPEKNIILKNWSNLGIKASNAYETQALIQLFNNYCTKKRCLDCRIGLKLIVHEKQNN